MSLLSNETKFIFNQEKLLEKNIHRCPKCYTIPFISIENINDDVPMLNFKCLNGHEINMNLKKLYLDNLKNDLMKCNNCNESDISKLFYCIKCFQFYCEKEEHSLKEGHNFLLPFKQMDSSCYEPEHNKNHISLFCKTHNKNICYYCKYDIHEGDSIEDLKLIKRNEIDNFKNKINNIKNNFNKFLNELNLFISNLDTLIKELKEEFEKFKENNTLKLSLIYDLINIYEFKKKENDLNYQIIENIRNIISKEFNFETSQNNILKIQNTIINEFYTKKIDLNNEKEFQIGKNKFISNPSNLKFKLDLSNNVQTNYTIDNRFDVYIAYDKNTYLAMANGKTHEIEIMNLKNNSVIQSLKGHSSSIYIIRHYFESKSLTDYLLSTSEDKNIKVWNLKEFKCQININQIHSSLYSSLLLFDDNLNYIITSTYENDYLKIWDFKTGKFIRNIGSSNGNVYFIDYWKHNNNYYIINGNASGIILYGINKENEIYREFKSSSFHMSAFIEKINEVNYLFESTGNGYLNIWNIETSNMYKSIQAVGCALRGICFWNDKYIIASSNDISFKIFDLDDSKNIISVSGHDNTLSCLKKIIHPIYGESLITFAVDGKIKLWCQE